MSQSKAAERLNMLRAQHQTLKQQVERLERRPFLTGNEQLHVTKLKKQKLLAKDRIAALTINE